ncbi:MAG: hypothetical protein JWP37_2746 [Mucilaginibacter sp.]|nr:hypothetical protein [Mucilaginibacter sp.]
MKKTAYIAFLIVSALVVTAGCKKPYLPPVVAVSSNFLVVEGLINTGSNLQDSTIIKLSRTVKLASSNSSNPELKATVKVESDANVSYPLAETGDGYYMAPGLNLSAANKYRLQIITADSRTYQSDFVQVKNSPPIDSVKYLVKSDGVQININTHDPANKTTYYRWSYDETWIIHSNYNSHEELITTPFDTIVFRPAADQIYRCWQSHIANVIVLASTANLKQDVISQNELTSVASTSEKISDRYTILVKQYALTGDAFKYWQQLKKNTEQLGSIFDAQPSEIPGNIHCITNPSEPVLGFMSAGTFSQSRIFIDNLDLPLWKATPAITGCTVDVFPYKDADGIDEVRTFLYFGHEIPLDAIQPPGSPISGYTAALPKCVDCTLRGTKTQPSFWINR